MCIRRNAIRRPGLLGTVAALLLLSACSAPYPTSMAANQPGLVRVLTGHTLWVLSVAWSPDGKYVASGGRDNTLRIWDAATGQLVTTQTFRGGVTSLAWSPDSKYLATGSDDPNIQARVWDATSWQPVQTWNPPTTEVNSLSWAPDGQRLVVGTDWVGTLATQASTGDSAVEVYAVASGQRVAVLTDPDKLYAARWSPNGQQIAFSIFNWTGKYRDPPRGKISVWDLSAGDGPRTDTNTITLANLPGAYALDWAPNGQSLAVGGDTFVQILDLASHQPTASFSGHTHVAWSPDGKRLAASATDQSVAVWDIAGGQKLATFQHPDVVSAISWAPDSTALATACYDQHVYIWEVK